MAAWLIPCRRRLERDEKGLGPCGEPLSSRAPDEAQHECCRIGHILLCMGLFSRFWVPALRCTAEIVEGWVSCVSQNYRFRSRKACIIRCGSPDWKDFPNTPTLRLTDSVSGNSCHCRSS